MRIRFTNLWQDKFYKDEDGIGFGFILFNIEFDKGMYGWGFCITFLNFELLIAG